MTVPSLHEAWVNALKLERPWEENDTTRTLVGRVKDEDMAAVIWALERTNALKWLDLKLPALGGESPASEPFINRPRTTAIMGGIRGWYGMALICKLAFLNARQKLAGLSVLVGYQPQNLAAGIVSNRAARTARPF